MSRIAPFLDDIVVAAVLLIAIATLVPLALPWAVLAVGLYTASKLWIFRSHLRRPSVGVEAMPGRVATALTDLAPRGHVDLDGERWDAEAAEPVRAGERVEVRRVEGLRLHVAPLGVLGGRVREPPRGSALLALAQKLRRAR